MKRRIVYYISCMLTILFVLGACQDDDWGNKQATDRNNLTLNLSTLANTRADVAGDNRFNENVVTRADVFFFSVNSGNQDSETCLYAQTGLVPTNNILQVQLDKGKITDGTTYYIYIVANCDLLGDNDATTKTLADLKSTVIATNWKNGSNESDVTETSLVMDGAITVEISPEGTNENVELKRAMAKVMLYPTTGDPIVMGEGENKVTYTPMPSAMSVIMYNGVSNTNLAGDYAVQTSDYIERMERKYAMQGNKYEQAAPFYSYPNPANTASRQNAYLILCVPWSVKDATGAQSAVNYYYRVPITGSDAPALLERNKYYEIHSNIGVLGSLDPTKPVTLTSFTFLIKEWSTMQLAAEMSNYQYLVLDEYNSVMNNVDELEMPYISSSPIDWGLTEIVSVSYPDYSDVRFSTVLLDTPTEIGNAGFTLSENNGNLKISHTLTADDYVPYTITVKVWNTDDVEADLWTITQYPAIYIEGKRAEGRLFVAGEYCTSGQYEAVYHNNYYLGTVQNPNTVNGDGTNNNYNNYTIYVTSFDVGDNYAIGDPRTLAVDNLNMSDLHNYYPARTDDDTRRVIAPAFKIASSRGKTLQVSFNEAQRRCAAYQEDGYGAGRWRIPTEAEIEFIVNLSAEGEIPTLFDGQYWSASGRYYSSDSQSFRDNGGDHYVRCVYDIWYWGTEQADLNQFEWRD